MLSVFFFYFFFFFYEEEEALPPPFLLPSPPPFGRNGRNGGYTQLQLQCSFDAILSTLKLHILFQFNSIQQLLAYIWCRRLFFCPEKKKIFVEPDTLSHLHIFAVHFRRGFNFFLLSFIHSFIWVRSLFFFGPKCRNFFFVLLLY